MKNEKFETHQCFIWILMKNMSITEVFVSTPPLSFRVMESDEVW